MSIPSRGIPVRIARLHIASALLWIAGTAPALVHAQDAPASGTEARQVAPLDDSAYIRWLEERSMLKNAEALARAYSGNAAQWRHPYALPQPRAAAARASVWFTAYPASTMSPPDSSVLHTLANAQLWEAFEEIGIQGVHAGPMKRAEGITGTRFTPTVDGSFDRIAFDIDPEFGSQPEYLALVAEARRPEAIIISDVIPGHTGKGTDFRLAERAYGDYPGLYRMVVVDRKDWGLLPPVPDGYDAINLSAEAVDALAAKGYIVVQLQRTFFHQAGSKTRTGAQRTS